MKSKILQLSWKNQLIKLVLVVFLILTRSFASPSEFADFQKLSKAMGIIKSLEKNIDESKSRLSSIKGTISKDRFYINLNKYKGKPISLSPDFIENIFLFSDDNYLNLINNKKCNFYLLLEHGLLKTSDGVVNNVLVDIKEEKKISKAIVTKKAFLAHVYNNECVNNNDLSYLFNQLNIVSTVKRLKFKVPKSEGECNTVFNDWFNNPYTPGLCKITETIKESKRISMQMGKDKTSFNQQKIQITQQGKEYINKIDLFKRSYISNICKNLNNKKRFCSLYLSDDIWRKITDGGSRQYQMIYPCKDLLKKESINNEHLQTCRLKFLKDKSICKTIGSISSPANFPKPNCEDLASSIKKSKLITNYNDCPSKVDNFAITNIHRLFMHFKSRELVSSSQTCSGEMNSTFADLLMNTKSQINKSESNWPMNICFNNIASGNEECLPYIPGGDESSKLSEPFVVGKVLNRIVSSPQDIKCSFIDSKSYKPLLLEYRHGCFIVYDKYNCRTTNCKKKIFYNKKEIKNIKYRGNLTVEYIPFSYQRSSKSLLKILELR